METEITCTRCGSHSGYLAHESRNRHEKKKQTREKDTRIIASKRVVRNMEERNVSTKGRSPKQGLTSAADITMMHPNGRGALT